MDGFADVVRENGGRVVQVGDGAGDFQNPVVGAGAEVQFGHCHSDEVLAGFVELAVRLEVAGGHPGVACHFAFAKAFALDGARGLNPAAD